MGKKNKVRYTRKDKPLQLIEWNGRVGLLHLDDEQIDHAMLGDMMVSPHAEKLETTRIGEYDTTGHTGYFRFDIWNGKQWCPIILSELFPQKEHYFNKKERPIDTYAFCVSLLEALPLKHFRRTYREHYEMVDEAILARYAEEQRKAHENKK